MENIDYSEEVRKAIRHCKEVYYHCDVIKSKLECISFCTQQNSSGHSTHSPTGDTKYTCIVPEDMFVRLPPLGSDPTTDDEEQFNLTLPSSPHLATSRDNG